MTGLLKGFLVTWIVLLPFATSQSLVITGLVDHPDFSVLELTACSFLHTLSAYEFDQYLPFDFFPNKVVDGDDELLVDNIPAGSRIYIATSSCGCPTGFGMTSIADFEFFFGFTPDYFLLSDNLDFFGNYNFELAYDDDPTVVDVYGTVPDDNSGGPADFHNGWVSRKTGASASPNFDMSEWVINTDGVYFTDPLKNSDVNGIRFGTYHCPPTQAPSQSPTTHPTSRPTLPGRLRNRDNVGDKNRPPTTPTARAVLPTAPPTPAPVAPAIVPTPNPRRKKPSRS